MSAVLTPPQPTTAPPPAGARPAGPQPYRWTLDEYKRLFRAGFFEGLNTILLHGEVYVMPPPSPPHDATVGLVAEWLRTAFVGGSHVRTQMSFGVGADSDLGPDVAVARGSIRDYAAAAPTAAEIVVEVALTSLFKDTTEKAELYATAGVPDYWVLDLEGRRLLVFRDPEPRPAGLGATAYRTRTEHGPAATVAPLLAPHAAVTVADLLP